MRAGALNGLANFHTADAFDLLRTRVTYCNELERCRPGAVSAFAKNVS